METGTAAVSSEGPSLTKADLLTDLRKVVSGRVGGQTPAALADKKRYGTGTKNAVAFGTACTEAFGGACRDRNDTALAVLGVPDLQYGRFNIDIAVVESDCFADPQPRDRQQSEQRRTIQGAKPVVGRKSCGFGHDPGDLAVGVDVGS